jgi:hypothetical protein
MIWQLGLRVWVYSILYINSLLTDGNQVAEEWPNVGTDAFRRLSESNLVP